jgi:hypothetical protein
MKGIEPGILPSNSLQKGKRKCEKEKENAKKKKKGNGYLCGRSFLLLEFQSLKS